MLLLLSYYCYCSLTTATTLYYTLFLSFACFAVHLLLPNYYYSAMSLSHSFLARLNCSFLATLLCFGQPFGVDLKQSKDLA